MILKGNPVSPGMAIGRTFLYKPFSYMAREKYFEAGQEFRRVEEFDRAVKAANEELNRLLNSFEEAPGEKAEIIKAHKELLEDEEIIAMVHESISRDRKMPDYAVSEVFSEFIALLGKVNDPLIAGRVSDLKDVRDRILRILLGRPECSLSNLPGKVVVVAHDLLPSVAANLDRENVLAIVTEMGGETSHLAIIARSCGIPAVLGVENVMGALSEGDEAAVNAVLGTVTVALTNEEKQNFNAKKIAYEEKAIKTAKFFEVSSEMLDGTRIETGINIGSDLPGDGYRYGDFVGLFRTEFLYMENDHLPSEEEQFRAYRKVVENAGGKSVTIRTLDIGGDKNLSYLDLPKEQNPFLGKRALRLCLDHKDIFKTQLRAILRASAYGEIGLMFPMVGSMDDIFSAKAVLQEAVSELDADNLTYDKNMKVGAMIEIPSAALIADLLAEEVDFASIGTNDLCQYLTATDRMNSEIGSYYQSMAPAMLRILKMIADAFQAAGKPLSVCGELAGDPRGAVVLAGLGIRKLSMSSSNLAGVKESLSQISAEKAAELARKLLRMKTQDEVLRFLSATLCGDSADLG